MMPKKELQPPPRVVIEGVAPEIDHGRFPMKRTLGEKVVVSADIFAEGHSVLNGVLKYKKKEEAIWQESFLKPLPNDRWVSEFAPNSLGTYQYTVQAWPDPYATWRKEVIKKFEAGQRFTSEWQEGAVLISQAAERLPKDSQENKWLAEEAKKLASKTSDGACITLILNPTLFELMTLHVDRSLATSYPLILEVIVERERARYGAWYEFFPRSTINGRQSKEHHGSLKEAESRLPEIANMGFDVIYLPPIHPIGQSFRKGPNNTSKAGPSDPGSPWAIGSEVGGHKAVHPELGLLEDFQHFIKSAKEHGLEVALDLAYQCSPDHPYAKEHPEWFRQRPDGTIKYAENPPKKYEDIYPLDFECASWQALWQELKSVVLFWIEQGVRIFRVDNPHTKPFAFWEWLIKEVQAEYPDIIFLSEAFARPKIMKYLAKLGFTQSYTYFTWRNTKNELESYLKELIEAPVRDYLRPNFFANTPDILHEYLQFGGRGAFQARFILAATLGATYGIYGPPFELCEGQAYGHSEEYLNSEKYQVRHWDWNKPGHIKLLIARVNQIRKENEALHFNERLRFYPCDNEQIICYAKTSPDLSNILLMVVNLDPHHVQSGWVHVPLDEWQMAKDQPFQVHELIGGARYLWQGEKNYVQIDPLACPAHVFKIRKKIKTEKDFDYFL